MATVADLAHDFRRFRASKEMTKALRRRIREPVPTVRRMVKARALAILPARGGLGAWVASSRLTASVRLRGSGAAILLKAGRNSRGSRSDVRAIDRGRVRHPTFGRRASNAWHTQSVPAD